MKRTAGLIFLVLLVFALTGLVPGCKHAPRASSEEEVFEEFPLEEPEDEVPPKPAPPKVTEESYVDLTIQSVLIRERNKEDAAAAEQEVLGLYEKLGITVAEVKEFEQKLTLEKMNELQRKIQEKLQAFIK